VGQHVGKLLFAAWGLDFVCVYDANKVHHHGFVDYLYPPHTPLVENEKLRWEFWGFHSNELKFIKILLC
jgi:hypothetical protein